MAPRGVKRPAAFEDEALLVKKALLGGDTGAVMLAGMCQALTVPKADRHEFQASTVGMIGEALSVIETSYANSCESMKAAADAVPSSKDARKAAVADASKELESLKEAVAASMTALGAASKEAEEALEALKKAKKEQKDGDAVLGKVESKKATIEATQAESVAFIGENAVTAANKALKAVLKLGKDLGLDDSLLSVLPAVVRKPKEARSEFEQASFQNVVTMFGKEVEKLAAEIAEGQAGKAARAEAAASAQAVLDEAGQKKIAAETALEEAKTAEKVGAVALRNTEKNVASWLGDSKRTLDSYDEAEAAKADFASVLATFEKLKELEPPPPEPEAAAEEPVADPAPEAEPAAEAPAA